MIKSVNQHRIDNIFNKDYRAYYEIPKYQREYTWSLPQWKDIFDDIYENDEGYFIGSIICINNGSDSLGAIPFEVIDGQQRLTTISLLLAAIYNKMLQMKDLMDEEQRSEIFNLKKMLIQPKLSPNNLMVVPQKQNHNDADYACIMNDNGLPGNDSGLEIKTKRPNNLGNRKIAKCYRYFLSRIDNELDNSDNKVKTLLLILKKILSAVLVKIEVSSHAEAYTLFESLNNRGTPLTASDLMKNLILAKSEKINIKADDCFELWNELLIDLSDDYSVQERFFRHYYNAFKNQLNEPFRNESNKKKDPLGYIATRSNLLKIYEALINKDLKTFLKDILHCGKIYSQFLLTDEEADKQDDLYKSLQQLSRIQGAPAYLLLLYLIKNETSLNLNKESLVSLVGFLTKFFVRRNLTDVPNTRDLTTIFMTIIEEIQMYNLSGTELIHYILQKLIEKSASDEIFAEKLDGKIYEENTGVARFVLCSLTEKYMTNEKFTDLWSQKDYSGKKVYEWTIEHIFPEGNNIPDCWVEMIAKGDKKLAKQYLEQYVHKIGNLTISGYNSALSNKSFEEKRDRKSQDGKYIGYKNGLQLNDYLKNLDSWTIENIKERTDILKKEILDMFKF
ncbi:MAG: DUF262 domain-containing protein [Clostridia bacterium]|nr:DUF262 domain-containing protein [Clostridia bacterium]